MRSKSSTDCQLLSKKKNTSFLRLCKPGKMLSVIDTEIVQISPYKIVEFSANNLIYSRPMFSVFCSISLWVRGYKTIHCTVFLCHFKCVEEMLLDIDSQNFPNQPICGGQLE